MRRLAQVLAATAALVAASAAGATAAPPASFTVAYGPGEYAPDGTCLASYFNAAGGDPIAAFSFIVSPTPLSKKALKTATPVVVEADEQGNSPYVVGDVAVGDSIYAYITGVGATGAAVTKQRSLVFTCEAQ